MISQHISQRIYHCLSTDDKPVNGVRNGDKLIEIDTSKEFFYDATGEQWVEYTKRYTAL